MNFYDWLIAQEFDLATFGAVIIGVVFAGYIVCWLFPRLLLELICFIVSFFGIKTDMQIDKFKWDINTYIHRKIDNLYDDIGYCKKSIFYKYKVKNWRRLHEKQKD